MGWDGMEWNGIGLIPFLGEMDDASEASGDLYQLYRVYLHIYGLSAHAAPRLG